MKPTTVLDASAVLAFLQGEPGAELVGKSLQSERCVVTAANHAEVFAKSLDRGGAPDTVNQMVRELGYTVVDSSAEDGAQAGWLRAQTRALGLSLGDRLCLAAGQRLHGKILTADRPWLAMAQPLGLNICCIRPDVH